MNITDRHRIVGSRLMNITDRRMIMRSLGSGLVVGYEVMVLPLTS